MEAKYKVGDQRVLVVEQDVSSTSVYTSCFIAKEKMDRGWHLIYLEVNPARIERFEKDQLIAAECVFYKHDFMGDISDWRRLSDE